MDATDLKQLVLRLRIITAALIASVAVYVVVGWFAVSQGWPDRGPLPEELFALLAVLAGSQLLARPATRWLLVER